MIGRVAYAALFVAVWPAYLVALGLLVDWPGAMRRVPEVGWPLAVAGLGILVAGIAALLGGAFCEALCAESEPTLCVSDAIVMSAPMPRGSDRVQIMGRREVGRIKRRRDRRWTDTVRRCRSRR